METMLSGLPNLKIRQKVRDDDSIDQLHHFVTVYLFAFAGVIIGLKELAGEPLDCWVEMNNWKHFQSHVNSYCWAHRMYKFPNQANLSQIPYPLKEGMSGPDVSSTNVSGLVGGIKEDLGEINFYRWVTVIFFIQAFLFKLPALVWSECNEYSGTQIEKMVSMVTDSTFDVKEKRDSVFATLAEFMEMWLKINRKPFWFMKSRIGLQTKKILRYCMLCVGGNTGNYLSTMYLVIKFWFLMNVLMQFMMLTAFLDFNYWQYGPYAVTATSPGNHNTHFPRVGLCHFQLKGEGQWIQCMLSINMLLEKIFLIEWFWLLLLLIVTIISFITWIFRTLQTHLSVRFIRKYLSLLNADGSPPQEGKRTVDTFVVNYLGNDGVFVLRILGTNTNDVAMSELICCIWERYIQYENKVYKSQSSIQSFAKDGAGTVLEMDPLDEKTVV